MCITEFKLKIVLSTIVCVVYVNLFYEINFIFIRIISIKFALQLPTISEINSRKRNTLASHWKNLRFAQKRGFMDSNFI